MTDDLVEEIARVLDRALSFEIESDVYAGETTHEERKAIARALSPIIERLQIEAAKRMQDAAIGVCSEWVETARTQNIGIQSGLMVARHLIDQIDPATIIGANHGKS